MAHSPLLSRRPGGRLAVALLGAACALGGASRASAEDFDPLAGPLLAQESMDDLFESDGAATDTPAEDEGAATAPAEEAPTAEAPGATSPEPLAAPTEEAAEPTTTDDLFAPAPAPSPETPEAAVAATPVAPRAPAVKVSGFVQNEMAYTVAEPDHLSKFRTRTKLRANGRLNDRVKWQLGGDFSYDPNFDFNQFYNRRVRNDQDIFAFIDETFLDIDAGAWDIRLGRQHIIWGEMVGLFFADVVSALDLREFVLPDFEMIRIPQWAARAEYFNGDFHADLIFVPYVTKNELGKFGGDFFLFPVELPPGVDARFREDKIPSEVGQDSGYGTRLSYLLNGWDMALFYYTAPDRQAAYERRLDALAPVPALTFFPRHNRIHQVGATVAKDLGSVVLKAEAVETTDRAITMLPLADLDGLEKSDELRYVFGADWSGDGHNVNLQFFQTWLQDHRPGMLFEEIESGFSVLLTTTRFGDDITPEILWIRSLDRDEWLLEVKTTWNISGHWRGVLGADVFGGPPTGVLGQFEQRDRVYYELRYTF